MEEELDRKINRVINEEVQADNLPVLKLLICKEEGSTPVLYDCQAKRSVCDQIIQILSDWRT